MAYILQVNLKKQFYCTNIVNKLKLLIQFILCENEVKFLG